MELETKVKCGCGRDDAICKLAHTLYKESIRKVLAAIKYERFHMRLNSIGEVLEVKKGISKAGTLDTVFVKINRDGKVNYGSVIHLNSSQIKLVKAVANDLQRIILIKVASRIDHNECMDNYNCIHTVIEKIKKEFGNISDLKKHEEVKTCEIYMIEDEEDFEFPDFPEDLLNQIQKEIEKYHKRKKKKV
jgi:hypothetical protein